MSGKDEKEVEMQDLEAPQSQSDSDHEEPSVVGPAVVVADEEEDDEVDLVELKDAIKHFDHKKKQSRAFRDGMFFLFWIAGLVVIVFLWRDVGATFEQESSLRDLFLEEEFNEEDTHIRKTFRDIGEISELWQWMQGPLVNGIGQKSHMEEAFILGHNRLLGRVRVRQLRVKNDSCKITEALQPFVPHCYAAYSELSKDMEPFGLGEDHEGWYWRDSGAPPIVGHAYSRYDGGGYFIDLSYNGIVAAKQIADLQNAGWIDRQTKCVLVSINVYNANVNNFLSLVFMAEITRGGGLMTKGNFRAFRADLYLTPTDGVRLIFEFIFSFTLIINILYSFWDLVRFVVVGNGTFISWFTSPWWNTVDMINKILMVIIAVLYLIFLGDLNEFSDSITDVNQNEFTSMEYMSFRWLRLFDLAAVCIFLSTCYLFKFLNLNFRMGLLWKTLEKAGTDIVSFILFFFLILLSFVAVGNLIFGTELHDWWTIEKSFFACFKMILGDFDYEGMSQEGNRLWAPIFFVMFIVLVFFILVNMFLAILNSAWDNIQDELEMHDTLGESLRKMVKKGTDKMRGVLATLRNRKERKEAAKLQFGFLRGMVDDIVSVTEGDNDELQSFLDHSAASGKVSLRQVTKELGLGEYAALNIKKLVQKHQESAERKKKRQAERRQTFLAAGPKEEMQEEQDNNLLLKKLVEKMSGIEEKIDCLSDQ